MKSYSSREVIKMLKEDGWYEVNVEGSHHQFKHPVKRGGVLRLNIRIRIFRERRLIVLNGNRGLCLDSWFEGGLL